MWAADLNGAVWKITTSGVGTQYVLSGAISWSICVGSDNNLWVTDQNASVWKVTTGGDVTQYSLAGNRPIWQMVLGQMRIYGLLVVDFGK